MVFRMKEHNSLLPILRPTHPASGPAGLTLAGSGSDFHNLHIVNLLYRLFDLRFIGTRINFKRIGIQSLCLKSSLLGNQRANHDVKNFAFHGLLLLPAKDLHRIAGDNHFLACRHIVGVEFFSNPNRKVRDISRRKIYVCITSRQSQQT